MPGLAVSWTACLKQHVDLELRCSSPDPSTYALSSDLVIAGTSRFVGRCCMGRAGVGFSVYWGALSSSYYELGHVMVNAFVVLASTWF